LNCLAAALAILATGCLVAGLSVENFRTAAFLAGAAGAAWVAILAWRPRTPTHGLFLCAALGAAGLVAARGHSALALAGTTAALFAWDAVSVGRLLAALPATARRKMTPHYLAQAALTAGAVFGVPLLALAVRPSLSFPGAFGLLLGTLFLMGLALWQSGRLGRGSLDEEASAANAASPKERGERLADSAGRSPPPA
jgi:hypothetical protein